MHTGHKIILVKQKKVKEGGAVSTELPECPEHFKYILRNCYNPPVNLANITISKMPTGKAKAGVRKQQLA